MHSNLIWIGSIVFFVALLSSYIGVDLLRRWAEQRMLDIPNERSSHVRPTPRGGGLLIVVCTIGGLWLSAFFLRLAAPVVLLISFSLGAILIAWVSWLDDLHSLSNRSRFGAHIAGALLVTGGIGFLSTVEVPFLPPLEIGWFGILITFFWLTGFTNAYNFMDGIDGLAGAQAVVAGLAWLGIGLLQDIPLLTTIGLLIATSSLGFLGHNWPPARIFMGDVGSAFLGFTLATLPIIGAQTDSRLPVFGVLILWPFVFDTTFTLLRRLQRGENIFAAHRSHLYQRMVIAGYSHRHVTLVYMALALIGVFVAYLWILRLPMGDLAAAIVPILGSFGLWYAVVHAEARASRVTSGTTTVTR